MLKNSFKLLIAGLMLFGITTTVKAVSIVNIQTLPSYINYNSFKLSCTTDGNTAQFYYSKNGGAYTAFGPAINVPSSGCFVQVDSSVINDQTTYAFKVNVDGMDSTNTTSTIFDNSGPDPVSGYYKDGLSDGFRLHWTNPTNSDFAAVKIYRGNTPDFSADSSHEIATVLGGASSPMTYEDHNGSNWYYDIRAIDKAGNSSALVGDATGITTTTVTTPTPGTGQAIILPKEKSTGSVLGTEATPSPTPSATIQPGVVGQINQFAQTTPQPFRWILTHKKISLVIAILLIGAAYALYRFSKRGK